MQLLKGVTFGTGASVLKYLHEHAVTGGPIACSTFGGGCSVVNTRTLVAAVSSAASGQNDQNRQKRGVSRYLEVSLAILTRDEEKFRQQIAMASAENPHAEGGAKSPDLALERDHLRGAALDVYDGEFERAPIPRLWLDSKVLITPHISGALFRAAQGQPHQFRGSGQGAPQGQFRQSHAALSRRAAQNGV